MLAALKAWWEKGKAARAQEEYRRGYNYAAGQLIQEGPAVILQLESEADSPFYRTLFDAGMLGAIRDFQRRFGSD